MSFNSYIQGLQKLAWQDYLSGREEKRAEITKNIANDDLQLLANDIVKMLRKKALENKSQKETSSTRLDSLLADALDIYLTSSIEGSSTGSNIDKMIEKKQQVRNLSLNYKEAADADFIAEKTGLPEDFIETTLLQYASSDESGKEDPVSFLQATDGRKIKTYFNHRWTKILNMMHSSDESGSPLYKKYSASARRELAELLPVHKAILEGSGWGSGQSRQTKKSYVEMFYEFLDQPYRTIEG